MIFEHMYDYEYKTKNINERMSDAEYEKWKMIYDEWGKAIDRLGKAIEESEKNLIYYNIF